MLFMVDEDTRSFDRILAAMGLPKGTPEEQTARKDAITEATKGAINTPLRTMHVCVESMGLMKAMAETGLQASVSDAGVGRALRACRCDRCLPERPYQLCRVGG
ncbi:MAG: cyclodeaminase/cyclohydrolase family protein [Flavobacteriales bacterium]